ncbi:MAG: hypothetical protein HYY18_16085 [Planctomycetes bacterium]|nr:hypothetical protein [Planctomycetota bacterium]
MADWRDELMGSIKPAGGLGHVFLPVVGPMFALGGGGPRVPAVVGGGAGGEIPKLVDPAELAHPAFNMANGQQGSPVSATPSWIPPMQSGEDLTTWQLTALSAFSQNSGPASPVDYVDSGITSSGIERSLADASLHLGIADARTLCESFLASLQDPSGTFSAESRDQAEKAGKLLLQALDAVAIRGFSDLVIPMQLFEVLHATYLHGIAWDFYIACLAWAEGNFWACIETHLKSPAQCRADRETNKNFCHNQFKVLLGLEYILGSWLDPIAKLRLEQAKGLMKAMVVLLAVALVLHGILSWLGGAQVPAAAVGAAAAAIILLAALLSKASAESFRAGNGHGGGSGGKPVGKTPGGPSDSGREDWTLEYDPKTGMWKVKWKK